MSRSHAKTSAETDNNDILDIDVLTDGRIGVDAAVFGVDIQGIWGANGRQLGSGNVKPKYFAQIYIMRSTNIVRIRLQTVMGLIGFAASLVLMCIVKFAGKRRIYLTSIAGSSVSCFLVGKYFTQNRSVGPKSRTACSTF